MACISARPSSGTKEHPVLTRKDYMGDHEWAFYGWREGAAHQFFGPSNATDVWSVKKVNPQNMVHLTEKPVELAVRAMQYSSRPDENVLDLFGGSGSTLIAAEQTGRRCFLLELDPLYCDVMVHVSRRSRPRRPSELPARMRPRNDRSHQALTFSATAMSREIGDANRMNWVVLPPPRIPGESQKLGRSIGWRRGKLGQRDNRR